MSAFMVNNGTIDRAVSAVFAFNNENPPMLPDVLGAELIKLNMEALRQRYGDKPLAFTYAHRNHADADPVLARFKAVSCLTYQCCEGDVPETPLYKLLKQVEDDLAQQVAAKYKLRDGQSRHDFPAYNKLPWDFDD
jgi:hypothetical protein